MPLDELQLRFCQELKKVYEARYDRGWGSIARFAEILGVTPAQVSNMFAPIPRRCGDETWRREVAAKLGLAYDGLIGHGKKTCATDADVAFDKSDYRSIPLYESGRLAAGVNGMSFDPYEKVSRHAVVYSPELGHRSRHDLRAMRVGGDSMAPLIPEGSMVVVDVNDRDFIDNRIYAVAVEEGGVEMVATVKRVKKINGGFVLLPENRSYNPDIVQKDWLDFCLGRVVWLWRSLETA